MLFLYRILHAVWFSVMALIATFHPKIRQGLSGRKGLLSRVQESCSHWITRPYWFHFASSGEFEQAIPILEALKKKEPGVPIFLSFFSPTGKRAVELEKERRRKAGLSVPWDASDFSPLDFPWTVRAFAAVLRPRALVILNREFWPELFHFCKVSSIPVYVFAIYFSNQKARRILALYRPWLKDITFLGTTDAGSAEFLRKELGNRPIQNLGDPRIERVLDRRRLASPPSFEKPPGARIFVGASLWPEDFRALRESLALLMKAPNWKVFLVPHEPYEAFLRSMERELKESGFYSVRWSKRRIEAPLPGVLIVDSVGWLAELYRHADFAFVGGGFRSRVHNVLEPAAYGVPVITGPHVQNSFEAIQMNEAKSGVFVAQDFQELKTRIALYLSHPEEMETQGKRALEFLEQRRGAGNRYSDLLRLLSNP